MTLDRDYGDDPGEVRLVECPFCGYDFDDRGVRKGERAAEHLRQCDAFEAAWRDGAGEEAGAT